MAMVDTINSMYENVGEVYDTITNVDVNNGKNLFNDTIRQGVTTYDGGVYNYNATRLTSTNWITLRAGTYTINAKTNTSKTLQISNITFDTNDNFYNISGVSGIWKTLPFTFTTPIDIKWKYNFDYSDNSNITINEVNSIQLELGSSATDFQPYTDNPTYKNIENIPSTIRKSYLDIMNNGIDTIYDNWEKVNGTGTSISLNNTEEAPMTIEYKGNTSQGENPTPITPQDIHIVSGDNYINVCGKNLIISPYSDTTKTTGNLVWTLNNDGTILVNGTNNTGYTKYFNVVGFDAPSPIHLAPGTYTASLGVSSNVRCTIANYYNNTDVIATISANSNKKTFTITETKDVSFVLAVNNTLSVDNALISPQIEVGSTATTYEAYKGASYEINLGKNLLDLQSSIIKSLNTSGTWNENVYTHNGLTITINDDKTIKINGTATAQETFLLENQQIKYPTGTYYLSGSINGGNNSYDIRMFNYDGTSAVAQCYTGVKEINVINNKQVYNVAIVVRSGQTLNNVVFYPMFSTSNDTNYSPYFTPIELCKIGTYQDRIFKSSGKNLFNPATETKNYIVNSEGTLTPNNSYNSSAFIPIQPLTNVVLSTDQTSAILEIVEYDTNQSLINRGVKTNSTFYNLKTSNTTAYIRISYKNTSTKVQFEKGSSATTYEPYGKDWYLNKQIGKFTYNNEGSFTTPATNYYNINGLGNQGWITTIQTQTYISTEYPPISVLNTDSMFREATANMDYAFGIHPNGTGIRFKDSRGLSGEDFKTDLIGTEIYFALATPTYEKITGELLNQLEAIKKSYENQTNINQENNDLPFELEVYALEKY